MINKSVKFMKKIIILCCSVIFTLNLSAQYQGAMKFGVYTGANYTSPRGGDIDDLKDDIDDILDDWDDGKGGLYGRLGFHLGLSVEYALQDNLSIISGLSYSQKGFKLSYSGEEKDMQFVDYTDQFGNSQSVNVSLENSFKYSASVQLDYYELPICVKYQLDSRGFDGFNVFGGLVFSFLSNDNVDVEAELDQEYVTTTSVGYTILTDSYSDSDSDDYDDTVNDDDPNGTLTGFQIGVGYDMDNFNVSLKLNRSSKFGDLYELDGSGEYKGNKFFTSQLSIGYNF